MPAGWDGSEMGVNIFVQQVSNTFDILLPWPMASQRPLISQHWKQTAGRNGELDQCSLDCPDLSLSDQEAAEIPASWREEEIVVWAFKEWRGRGPNSPKGILVEGRLEGSKQQTSPFPRVPSGPTLGWILHSFPPGQLKETICIPATVVHIIFKSLVSVSYCESRSLIRGIYGLSPLIKTINHGGAEGFELMDATSILSFLHPHCPLSSWSFWIYYQIKLAPLNWARRT